MATKRKYRSRQSKAGRVGRLIQKGVSKAKAHQAAGFKNKRRGQ